MNLFNVLFCFKKKNNRGSGGGNCLIGTEIRIRKVKSSGDLFHNNMNILNTPELYNFLKVRLDITYNRITGIFFLKTIIEHCPQKNCFYVKRFTNK